ncbi:FeoA family protein [Candidatus Formimonas warabiya]|uniref:Ferrous iron transporter FeoA-like domain-containing protein n=1 Tax=Formimonas warabiya TaxID=1761012 RepID=A0A3G1KVJ6_FORW1|nr:ferrous iron transport protein A [Candidatus Formimonas warabiya]ATW26427.1 hypothetical protein DCMF_18195 [Candidatus Formimonas warabiya]
MKRRTLKDLAPGQRAKIVKINGSGAIRRRLVEMGVTPGSEVEMERYAPLGDPVEIKLKGTHLSLRKSEAEIVDIDPEGTK